MTVLSSAPGGCPLEWVRDVVGERVRLWKEKDCLRAGKESKEGLLVKLARLYGWHGPRISAPV
jgi:hypothetical protein